MKKIIQKQLGELLIDSKLITPENLTEGLSIQKEKGGLIGQVLVALGFVTEEAIAQALTAQYGFPYLPLGGYEIDPEVAKVIPEHVAKQYGLIAVDRVGSILTVAMSNPLNSQAIEDVEMITHFKVQIFVTTATDLNDAIKRCYRA
jgi:type IV pilus assembly protein PilB